jgi:hypothetical protein
MDKKIIIRLVGGLGNQMFQYAAGRAVAYRTNMPLKLDIKYFEKYKLRSYQLGCFNINEDFASDKEISYFKKPAKKQVISYMIHIIMNRCKRIEVIKQKIFGYNPYISKIKSSAYLDGYWQSEKYFSDVADIIRNEFTLKNRPNDENLKLLEKIKDFDSVSMHIRRGDYVSDPKTNETHGFIGLDYYNKAIGFISSRIDKPYIIVFSDDIYWARRNFTTSLPVYFISNDNGNDCEQLWLMSKCKHHIIANSSFSWWGAWLSGNDSKIVIAPEKWFADKAMESRDIYVDSWVKL